MRELFLRHRKTIVTVAGIALPLFLLYVHGRSPRKTTIIEQALMQVTAPVQGAASRLLSGLSDLWNGYVALVDVAADNAALREDKRRLEADSARLIVALAENERLRRELEFKRQRRDLVTVSAHVIGKDLSPYGRILRVALDAGSDSGVAEGMAVVNHAGLVGRVVRVSSDYAEVMLTVDARSVVNVRVLGKGVTGTVTGTSSPYNYVARMSYLHRAEPLDVGDLLVTSGHDKVFPPGLSVGTIRSLEERQRDIEYELQVTPAVNLADLEEVQIIVAVRAEATEPSPALPAPTPPSPAPAAGGGR
jgi:rod shape-determining protein MreC